MHHWTRRLFAAAAPLLLGSCLWGPGKFSSELALRKDGSFTLDYRGEMVLQLPPDAETKPQPWKPEMARCTADGSDEQRDCTPAEVAEQKSRHDKAEAERIAAKRKENEEMAKAFGLPGLDDESNRAFAAKLSKYAGWRSVAYRGKGVFEVDYHAEGSARQDFLFPALPDNDLVIPFVAIRRRADGSVLVTAPALTGGAGPIAARMGAAAGGMTNEGPQSRAQGRFTIVTDGEILTNNSEDGAAPHSAGRRLSWEVRPDSARVPEALIRLR